MAALWSSSRKWGKNSGHIQLWEQWSNGLKPFLKLQSYLFNCYTSCSWDPLTNSKTTLSEFLYFVVYFDLVQVFFCTKTSDKLESSEVNWKYLTFVLQSTFNRSKQDIFLKSNQDLKFCSLGIDCWVLYEVDKQLL